MGRELGAPEALELTNPKLIWEGRLTDTPCVGNDVSCDDEEHPFARRALWARCSPIYRFCVPVEDRAGCLLPIAA
jgi:hypothetical protein